MPPEELLLLVQPPELELEELELDELELELEELELLDELELELELELEELELLVLELELEELELLELLVLEPPELELLVLLDEGNCTVGGFALMTRGSADSS